MFRFFQIRVFLSLLIIVIISGCASLPGTENVPIPTPTFSISQYAFPHSIEPASRYLFYLHGKIIEEQGIPAISPEYGEYQYREILESFQGNGFLVISEQRAKNTDGIQYAERVAKQVATLLDAGVPANNITVVGVSQGAAITIFVSNLVGNKDVNYVILAICHPDIVRALLQERVYLTGNVLSIYDSVDEYAGSCQSLFLNSKGRGLSKYDEVVLRVGTGHGILYQPLDEWILPIVQWALAP